MEIDKEYLKQIKRCGWTVAWIGDKAIIKKDPKTKFAGLEANNFRGYAKGIIKNLGIRTEEDCKKIREELNKIEL